MSNHASGWIKIEEKKNNMETQNSAEVKKKQQQPKEPFSFGQNENANENQCKSDLKIFVARPPRWGSSGAGAAAWSCHVLGRRKYTHIHTRRRREDKTWQDRHADSLTDLQQLQNFLATRSVIQCFLLSRLGLIIFSFLICIFNLIRMRLYAAQQSLCPCGCSSCKLNTRTHRHNITKNVDVWWLAKKKKKNTKKISESLLIYICLILDL